ncbi:MAG TPA: PA14 domain-containing protein [Verrucomicrobiae bacterium]|nr:PA14 domain-containing protein [Verrucomicrobiae bacterium]
MTLRVWSLLLLSIIAATARDPLALHPENSHYFLWRGKPTILITSGEHYGAVINLDFAYITYLDTLKADGLNLTRTFSGAYVEPPGAFNIARNTLAPSPGKYLCPWARSDTMGYGNGGRKFDLSQWDPDYFSRLKKFITAAGERGIVVEMNLFCPFYEEAQWKLSPMNVTNNVNGIGNVARTNVYTLDKHGGLLAVQEAMVRKIVLELNKFDNLYYEICNEAYFGGVTLEWQYHIAEVIRDAEFPLKRKHLISQNVANNKALIEDPHEAISIFNFHYASPPDTVAMNYHLNKVIGDNETGFVGTNDFPYRREGWDFIMAGGGLFNNLDYSFTTDNEDGTFRYPSKQPGGGNPGFRKQMRVLKDFIDDFDFIHMHPATNVIHAVVPTGISARCLGHPDTGYAIYVCVSPKSVDQFSVVWSGQVQAPRTGEYTFYTLSNDGVRLILGDHALIDNWTDHSAKEDSASAKLEANKKYPIKLAYYQGGGAATMKLYWAYTGQPKQLIPSTNLWVTDASANGLTGQYYFGKTFDDLKMTRNDPTINFDWNNKSPFDSPKPVGMRSANVQLNLPAGNFDAIWTNTRNGHTERHDKIHHGGGIWSVVSPMFEEDIALAIRK